MNKQISLFFRLVLASVAVVSLTACASRSVVSDILSAVLFDKTITGGVDVRAAALNPSYEYLRVELDGKAPALLVLGYLDPHPQGEIEVWYSSSGEVLKLQDGRVVGSVGLPVEWRRVSYPKLPPPWAVVNGAAVGFERVRDESPGYRLGLVEQVHLTRLAAPPATALDAISATSTWFQETYSNTGGAALPQAWFALSSYRSKNTIVYSRQCLSADVCLTLQRWPSEKDRL